MLETELNGKNVIVAINECVLPIITYSFGILNWLESDLKGFNVQMRKLMNMYQISSINSDVDRLYVPRKSGGRGLMSVWDAFKAIICRVAHVLCNSENVMLSACQSVDEKSLFSNIKRAKKFEEELQFDLPLNFREKGVLLQAKVIASCVRSSISERHVSAWKRKPQHGAFFRKLESVAGIDVKASVAWLSTCHLAPHSESYILAAQEMALITKYHEKNILKSREEDWCRVCKAKPETISHILFGCDVLAKREYFTRHNNVCKYIHHAILKSFGIPCADNWFGHTPKEVILQKGVEIIYDQVMLASRPIGANRPDLIVKDLISKKALIIDISCPNDINVVAKETEKVMKYQPLCAELRKMWEMECVVVPVIVGGLGVVSKNFNDHLAMLPGCPKGFMCQKIAMLGSERILRDVLGRRLIR